MAYAGMSLLARGREPWTLNWTKKDHEYTAKKEDVGNMFKRKAKVIDYPK